MDIFFHSYFPFDNQTWLAGKPTIHFDDFFPATIIHCPCLMGIFQEGMFDGTRGYFDLSEHGLYL